MKRFASHGLRVASVVPLVLHLGAAVGCSQTLYVDEPGPSQGDGGPLSHGDGNGDGDSSVPPTDLDPPPGMALITGVLGETFFIDRYEASAVPGSGVWGSEDQDLDDDGRIADAACAAAHAASHGLLFDDDGGEEAVISTTMMARSVPGGLPAEVSFYQAAAACCRAGKRLCTNIEWGSACKNGSLGSNYPYGDDYDGADAAGTDCWTNDLISDVQPTGSASACQTSTGVFDLSGNVEEWTGFLDPQAAYVEGGTVLSAPHNSTCGSVVTAQPWAAFLRIGFRCCQDP